MKTHHILNLTLFLLISSLSALGQSLTVSVPTITALPNQVVYIPVKLTGASSSGSPISSANIQITYDTAVLHYDTLTNFYSGTPQNQWFFTGQNGLVSANWLEPNLLTVAIPDNTTLYEIKFTYKGGNSPLTFVVYEFTGPGPTYSLIPTTPVNGAVNAVSHLCTFQVDMSRESVSFNGVHIAGSFNNWSCSQTPMVPAGNNIYTATVNLAQGVDFQYRFVNGNDSTGMESVPANCGVPNGTGGYNRQISVPDHDTTFPSVCFSMCGVCPVDVSVTFMVNLEHETISPDGVHIAGDFNLWNYGLNQMAPTGSGAIYEISFVLVEGTYYEYLFVNGNSSADAENPPAECSVNGHRFFTAPGTDTVMTAYCYDSCVACGVTAQYSAVTFQVDLRAEPSISPDGVHVAGTFQGWDPSATPMTTAGDSIYTYTGNLLSGTTINYKYVNGNDTTGYEIVPSTCASNGNRFFTVPDHDTVISRVCFAECDTCVIDGWKELAGEECSLKQNYPNPSAGETMIEYSLNRPGVVTLEVFNAMGKRVAVLADGPSQAGTFRVPYHTGFLAPGIYYYRLVLVQDPGTLVKSRKMLVQ